jgi:hypothetical protein
MKTITIEIKNEKTLSLLHDLEKLNLLKVIENKTTTTQSKRSAQFVGCLSKERSKELQTELSHNRNEWERGI